MPDRTEKQGLLFDLPEISVVALDFFLNHEQEIQEAANALEKLAFFIHKLNQKWWKIGVDGNYTRNKGEAIALMHSELSEALEGIRKDNQDEHLPEYKSEAVEFADCIIRILDFCYGFDIPVDEALFAKLQYNISREDHKLENRMMAGGKKF